MRIAAITMVYNEPVFLPMWVGYYGRELGVENLYVVDDGSDDGSVEAAGVVNRIGLPRAELDETKRAAMASNLAASLLTRFDVVIYVDSDEFIVPDPRRHAGLRAYLERGGAPVTAPVGLNLLHLADVEPPIDLTRPILSQRRYARFSGRYCKPVICREPVKWRPGFHRCKQPSVLDRDVCLFHLKTMDLELSLTALRKTQKIGFSEHSLLARHSAQFRWDETKFVERYFHITGKTVGGLLKPGFDFEDEIAAYDRRTGRDGSVFEIPDVFAPTIPGGRQVAADSTAPSRTSSAEARRVSGIRSIPGAISGRLKAALRGSRSGIYGLANAAPDGAGGSDKQETPMKISARNVLEGKVVEVTRGATTAHVRLDIGGTIVTSSITNAAADELKLEVGQTAYAVVKASDVMIGVDD